MKMIFRRKFEAAHRFIEGENANSLCSQPHGHTWSVEVEIEAKNPKPLDGKENMISAFEKVKKHWHKWIDNSVDHAFFYNHRDPLLEFMRKENPQGRHLVVAGDPTTEVLCAAFKAKLESILKQYNPDLICSKFTLHETQTNSISLSGDPKEHLPQGKDFWWIRADSSISDF